MVEDRRSVHDSSLYLVDVASGSKQRLTPDQGSYGQARFAKDGKGLYLTTDRGSEYERIAYLGLATHELIFLGTEQNYSSVIYSTQF